MSGVGIKQTISKQGILPFQEVIPAVTPCLAITVLLQYEFILGISYHDYVSERLNTPESTSGDGHKVVCKLRVSLY